MTSIDALQAIQLPQERRTASRRADPDRRQASRTERDRRSGFDRRESADAHVRNALQILQELADELTEPALQEKLQSSVRRLWLAIAEAERRRRQR